VRFEVRSPNRFAYSLDYCTMKTILTWVVLVALGCCLFSVSGAETGSGKPLRVGVSPIFPPMAFKQGRELVGVEVDLARMLGQKLGRAVVFVEVPWKDQIEALNEGKTDIIMSSMSVTMARRQMVNFTTPYARVGQMALTRREDKNRFSIGFPYNLKEKVGVVRATTGDFLVQRDFPQAKRKVYDTGNDAAQALIKKRIQLFISDSSLVWYLAGLHAADGLSVVSIPLSEESLAWAVRKDNDALLQAANEFLAENNQNGSLQKTLRRWIGFPD
jgi:ABC-type amino acid transport substrate-binding protein